MSELFDAIQKVKGGIMTKRAAVMDYGIVPGEPYVGNGNERVEPSEQADGNKTQIVAGKDEPVQIKKVDKKPPAAKTLGQPKVKKAPAADSTLVIKTSEAGKTAIRSLADLAGRLK